MTSGHYNYLTILNDTINLNFKIYNVVIKIMSVHCI